MRCAGARKRLYSRFRQISEKMYDKGILEGNVIWAVSVKDFPDLEPEVCSSMHYVGMIEV